LQAEIKLLERKGEYLSADILREASDLGSIFTIPVTVPSLDPATQSRVTGRVYLASEADVPVFRCLSRIFPGLSAWSTVKLKPAVRGDSAAPPEVVAEGSSRFHAHFAASTLALDMAATEATLPRRAAESGVPLVSLRNHMEQKWLWPDLTLAKSSVRRAAEKARWMLTDPYDAISVCTVARKKLTAASESFSEPSAL